MEHCTVCGKPLTGRWILASQQYQRCDKHWEPATPYAGTSGWSGTDTSFESEPRRRKAQAQALLWLEDRGFYGGTWKELTDAIGKHHGSTSGALSSLHKQKQIARLTKRRNGCRIYVGLPYVDGRETDEQGRKPRGDFGVD